jgi:cyclopropane-fatty-acyl-phospholipid synthase
VTFGVANGARPCRHEKSDESALKSWGIIIRLRQSEAMHAVSSEKSLEEKTLYVLSEIFSDCALEKVGVRLWDGTAWPDERLRPAVLALKHRGSLARMFLPGTEVGLAEAYLHDDFDIEGDIEAAFEIADFLLANLGSWKKKLKLAGLLITLPASNGTRTIGYAAKRLLPQIRAKRHSPERDRRVVKFHYDVSNDFYALWLDQGMTYSCAYFQSPDDALEKAQERKLDYICRKLRLRPGQRLFDIGCGWGALVIHAAKNFGARTEGITLSERQAEWARAQIAEAGLTNQATIELRDYRDLAANNTACYDAMVSVGMAEHVGREQLTDYFRIAHQRLKAGGIFLNQAIGEDIVRRPDNSNGSFIDDYVFPDGETPSVPIMLRAAESAGLEIRDVENLREHYALTLRHWLRRLESHHTEALSYVDEATYRVWRLYLAGSAHGFRRGHLAVYQTLLTKLDTGGQTKLPLTRNDWYA